MRQYKGIALPLDYERELRDALKSLEHHVERVSYHKASAQAYKELVEELIPFTGHEERVKARNKEQQENSKEFTAIRKKVKKAKARELVEIMLQRIKDLQ